MPDDNDFPLSDARIAIVGLGLMGGSLALALKGRCAHLAGLDPLEATLQLARDRNLVDLADTDPARILPGADLIILACPVPAILCWLRDLPRYVQNRCIVLDIGSTKAEIVEAMNLLPPNFDPLGGHPICGGEQLSLQNADAEIYRGAPFALSPLDRTTRRAMAAGHRIASSLGAHSLIVDAREHDRILASTSHLPFLIASALVLAISPNQASLIGPGFRSTTRLAATPSSMMLGVLGSNRGHILEAIARFQAELENLRTSLAAAEMDTVKELIDSARLRREAFTMKPG